MSVVDGCSHHFQSGLPYYINASPGIELNPHKVWEIIHSQASPDVSVMFQLDMRLAQMVNYSNRGCFVIGLKTGLNIYLGACLPYRKYHDPTTSLPQLLKADNRRLGHSVVSNSEYHALTSLADISYKLIAFSSSVVLFFC